MSTSVTALFKNRSQASSAVDGLLARGITEGDISVLMADSTQGKEFSVEVNSKAPEGAATGAAIGGALGAVAAGLTAVGTIALTGGAGIVAVGPIVAVLAGGGAGAAAGGITGGLIGLGFNENEAKLVDNDIENGSILVAAEVQDNKKTDIKSYFESAGASNVSAH